LLFDKAKILFDVYPIITMSSSSIRNVQVSMTVQVYLCIERMQVCITYN